MGDSFMGEIRVMSFAFAPRGWAQCNGQLLPTNQNQALFSLLGITYGGNGQTTFALPNLRDRVPMHLSQDHQLGESVGQQTHTLTTSELPAHVHAVAAGSGNATTIAPAPGAARYAKSARAAYGELQSGVAMHPQSIGDVGGSQPHNNEQPYLVLTFCISLQGVLPSRS